jgi:hypothetical protein
MKLQNKMKVSIIEQKVFMKDLPEKISYENTIKFLSKIRSGLIQILLEEKYLRKLYLAKLMAKKMVL